MSSLKTGSSAPQHRERAAPDAPQGEAPGAGEGSRTTRSGGPLHVMAGIASSRVLGLVREVLLARLAGVGAATDVFQVVFRGPNLMQNLLGEQALSAAFIPIYSRWLGQGETRSAARFAGAVLGLLGLVAAVIAAIGVIAAPVVVALLTPGFVGDPTRYEAAVAAVRLTFPMGAVLVLSAWCLAVLNSHRRFFLPYFAPALWNLSLVAVLGWLAWTSHAPSVRGLAVTLGAAGLVGAVLQLGIQLPAAARLAGGLRPRPSFAEPGVRPALRAFGPALLGRGVLQVSGYLELVLASLLAAGALSALGFAMRLYALPIALFGTSFSVVELPELSRLDRESSSAAVRERVRGACARMAFLTVPSAIGLIAFGVVLVRPVYERGAFTVEDTYLVAAVLAAYALGMVATTTSRLLQNVFFADRDTRTPALVSAARLAVSSLVGVATMLPLDRVAVGELLGLAPASTLQCGAVGLAFGSSVGAWFELALLRSLIARRRPGGGGLVPVARLVAIGALAVVVVPPAALLWRALGGVHPIALALAVVVLYAVSYLGSGWLLGLREAREVLRQAKVLVARR